VAYATASELTARYDARLIGDLATDDNTREDAATINAGSAPRVEAALADASADIDAALLSTKRYTRTQLDALQATPDPFLRMLCVDLALGRMYATRGRGMPDGHQTIFDSASERLADLRHGKITLELDAAIEAGIGGISRVLPSSRVYQYRISDRPLYPDDRGQLDPP
jgi:phage gp36-like protein